jgi:hypothetical protein
VYVSLADEGLSKLNVIELMAPELPIWLKSYKLAFQLYGSPLLDITITSGELRGHCAHEIKKFKIRPNKNIFLITIIDFRLVYTNIRISLIKSLFAYTKYINCM